MSDPKRLDKYFLSVAFESKEGIHEFIPMLEQMIEDIKGGYEKKHENGCGWEIRTKWK